MIVNKKRNYTFIIWISLSTIAQALSFDCSAQYSTNKSIWENLISIENNSSLDSKQKLDQVLSLKHVFDSSKLKKDSVYARILHRAGAYEYATNNSIPTENSISLILAAAKINSSGISGSSKRFLVNSYTNLGVFYETIGIYGLALKYYDSALITRKQYQEHEVEMLTLLSGKAYMFYKIGDYQRSIDQLSEAMDEARRIKDTLSISDIYIQRAQAYLMEDLLEKALNDIQAAGYLAGKTNNELLLTNSMFIEADILAKKKEYSKALRFYTEAIKKRITTENYSQIANDYIDMGNFFKYQLSNYSAAKKCYYQTIAYAKKGGNKEIMAKGHVNLGIAGFDEHHTLEAEQFYIKAFKDLNFIGADDILANPSATNINFIGNKELILVILGNKTELLQQKFKETGKKIFLTACLQTALLTDTLITNIRHEHLGEQSKLYWRNWTREFFTNAIEACWLANDTNLAFFFMEKSRAVLLNDKLNELGASSYLPDDEVRKERNLQIEIILARQNLSSLTNNTTEYEIRQSIVLQNQDKLEHYIRSLEEKYPAYYQYKYADGVVPLTALQKYLAEHNQSFAHYFMNDTVSYVLCITPHSSRIIKLATKNFDYKKIAAFNHYCMDKSALLSDYSSFASLSNTLYKTLFQPLQIPKGRVIISPDNFMLSFDALSADPEANHFLLNDYVFSYVYSARYLLNNLKPLPAKADFIGFAPVSFQSYLNVPDLKQSAVSLKKAAGYYNDPKLYIEKEATKNNFIKYLSHYSIVNIFSHAVADSSESEPLLYMQDSVIRLSELQIIGPHVTSLVILSGCETNVGKNATGEGVYSLARGFAAIGIPSVAATLWKADEESIYAITERFHMYLSQGISKDSALQKAKLDFIRINTNNEKSLPYYWAGMIITGDMYPIYLSSDSHILKWIIGGAVLLIGIVFPIVLRRRKGTALYKIDT